MLDLVLVVRWCLAVSGCSGSAMMRFSSLQHVASMRSWMSWTLCSAASSDLMSRMRSIRWWKLDISTIVSLFTDVSKAIKVDKSFQLKRV